MGGRRLQRGARVRARRQAHWQDSSSGNVRKPLFWRRQEKPTVHGRKPVSLRGVRRDPGRPDALTKCWHPPGGPFFVWFSWTCYAGKRNRSEEHTSELSHGSISYAVFCLKKKIH